MIDPQIPSRRRRLCALAVLLIVLVAACNRLVDLTPGDAFDNAADAADRIDGAGGNPPSDAAEDAAEDAGPDALPVDAAPDAI
jgi:hypothetical protein